MLATERPIQLVGVRHAPHTRLHVEFDRTLIEHHTRLLETYRTEGRDTSFVEHFIEAFEGSQKFRVGFGRSRAPPRFFALVQ